MGSGYNIYFFSNLHLRLVFDCSGWALVGWAGVAVEPILWVTSVELIVALVSHGQWGISLPHFAQQVWEVER